MPISLNRSKARLKLTSDALEKLEVEDKTLAEIMTRTMATMTSEQEDEAAASKRAFEDAEKKAKALHVKLVPMRLVRDSQTKAAERAEIEYPIRVRKHLDRIRRWGLKDARLVGGRKK